MSADSASEDTPADDSTSSGPVADLESHVSPDWWRTLFDGLYLQTDGDVVEDDDITAREIDAFVEALGPAEDARILDLCCGQGRHALELAERGYSRVEGLDYSSYLIDIARERARDAELPVEFHRGDARELPFEAARFDAVLLVGNSFGYFANGEDDLRVLKEVRRVLAPGGQLLLDLSDGDYLRSHFDERSWEWIDEQMFVCRERTLSRDRSRLVSRELVAHLSDGLLDDRFYAERLYSKTDVRRLLTTAGFGEITFKRGLRPDSKRNQDLGMMARRHLIRAAVRPGRDGRPASVVVPRDVAVVLSDPRLPDAIKPTEEFGAGDQVTMARLKEALRSLEGYQFHYLDNHENLLEDLQVWRDEFDYVLNLCDEGFRNDARNELHVPAVLEMLDLPYSGANPQCLAYCYDKSLVRGVAREMGIAVSDAVLVTAGDPVPDLPFDFPAIVKANDGDGSMGLTRANVVHDREALGPAIERIRRLYGPRAPVLIEEFLPGKDLTVGIIGNLSGDYTLLPIVEEDYSSLPADYPRVCGYEAKWLPDSPYATLQSIRADLPEETERQLEADSLKLSARLQCRDYVRVDWRLDKEGQPRLLEVNPNPGWCWDGHLAKQSEIIGWSYADMLYRILQAVETRLGLQERAHHNGLDDR